ncbi:MAG: NADPH:quinone oxidoreductase family protein [Solirubrobacteraceae bacterium]|nr:NADPH:quinone oxidoreductase family protein [Solirubrobacteraceae bacterium]
MRAVRLVGLDGPGSYVPAEVPVPAWASSDAVLVRVAAAGVGFPEALLARGRYQYRHELPVILGAEVAGTVVAAPSGSRFAPGDRVAALPFVGGFAEWVLAAPDRVFPLPRHLDDAEGAALPSNYLTALFALEDRGRVVAGETVVVHGAAGGLGTAALQVGRALGARMIAVVGTEAKAEVARAAGAHAAVVFDDDWRTRVADHAPDGVQAIFDPVGGERFTDGLRALAPGGRMIVVGFAEGTIPEVRVNRLLLRNVSVVGAALGSHMDADPNAITTLAARLVPLLEEHAVRPPVGARLPLERVADAVRLIEAREATGKVVVVP